MKLKTLLLSAILLGAIMTTVVFAQKPAIRLSLDGEWQFMVDSLKVGVAQQWFASDHDRSTWLGVQTPNFWESYPGMATYDGWGWFSRSFDLDRIDHPLSMHFAGVDDEAVVWVNGKLMGDHAGYSDPFALDIATAVRKGMNTVVVLVKDNSGGGGIYRPITVVDTKSIGLLLKSPFADLPARQSADWVRDAVIYSVYLRSFSPEGTFTGLERRVPELKELGITTIWLMPIHPVGVKNRKGTLGSPYAIQDYYGINPEFGTFDDFRQLLATVHKHGMKLIIDLVANHTSWDSKLITEHPEWFTKNRAGDIIAPNADWHDVADLDYGKSGLRRYMADMMLYWVRDIGIDGFRCDVAEMVPTDFWEAARDELDRVKPIMMLAEGSLPEEHVKAFDLTYSWNVYDAIAPLLSGKRPAALMDQILDTEDLQFPRGSLRMRFTTNHDKNAWDAPAIEKFGKAGLKLATVLVNTLPGVPMIYTGEEVANNRKLDLFEKVSVDWTRPRDFGDLYKMLFALRRANSALTRGEYIRVKGTPEESSFAFLRVDGAKRVFVAVNVGDKTARLKLKMPSTGDTRTEAKLKYREIFSGLDWSVPAAGGEVVLTLEGKGYRVFETR
jgi:cyclomaltodextrinase / maltogenic alpha-amylase / neopullulanase